MSHLNIPRFIGAASLGVLLAGCGPSVESAYKNCVETAYRQATASTKGLISKDTANIYEKSARAVAERQCSFIREECRDPQAAMCQRLVKQYGK